MSAGVMPTWQELDQEFQALASSSAAWAAYLYLASFSSPQALACAVGGADRRRRQQRFDFLFAQRLWECACARS
jgi:hypothetical protein